MWEEGGCSRLADRSAYRGEFVSLQGQIEHLPGGYLRECALGPGGEVREQGRSARAEGVCVPGFDAASLCLRLYCDWGKGLQSYLAHKNTLQVGHYRSPMPRDLW